MDFLDKLKNYSDTGRVSSKLSLILKHAYDNYLQALDRQGLILTDKIRETLILFLDCVSEQTLNPYPFEAFHEKIEYPVDYYTFGLDFFRPLIDFKHSRVLGENHLNKIVQQLEAKENVILLANHQTEPDPQIIALLLEKKFPKIAREMIFVAGHRVITDPMAIPFSMGCNLICVFSKKYIDHPPEQKEQKQLHNQRAMKRMAQLLMEGGKCIYVAPSGGRDRPNENGDIEVAPFDPQSLEMFQLMAKHSGHPTHFYPLALSTYWLTPPPDNIQKELGELRKLNAAPAHLSFGQEVDMENIPGSEGVDKKAKRQLRADYLHDLVAHDYQKLLSATKK